MLLTKVKPIETILRRKKFCNIGHRLEVTDTDENTKLIQTRINNGHKKFYSTGANLIKNFTAVVYEFL